MKTEALREFGMFAAKTSAIAFTGLIAATAAAFANDTGFAGGTHDLRREGGRLCIVAHTHGGTGTAGTKNVALIAAIKTFRDTTADEYGTDWANWDRSASKSVTYSKTTDGWAAHAEARPCK
jgi:hypothetical protein